MDIMEETQNAYLWASNLLFSIGIHPLHVKQGSLGYFMSVENIDQKVGLDLEANFKKLGLRLSLIKKEDLEKIKKTLTQISAAKSGESLEEACNECRRASLELTDVVLALSH